MKRILVLLLSLLLLSGCGHTQQEEPLPSMTEPMAADHTQWQQEPYYVLQFNVDSVISNAPAAAATSAGVVLTLVLIATTKPLVGKGYLYPLIPFDRRKLLRLLYRRPINRHNS